jgi:hypothetical protein
MRCLGDDLISLREAVEISGLSASYLRLLVSRGDIWGMRLGRNWVTIAQAVEEFLSRKRRRGPKPNKPWDWLSVPCGSVGFSFGPRSPLPLRREGMSSSLSRLIHFSGQATIL